MGSSVVSSRISRVKEKTSSCMISSVVMEYTPAVRGAGSRSNASEAKVRFMAGGNNRNHELTFSNLGYSKIESSRIPAINIHTVKL